MTQGSIYDVIVAGVGAMGASTCYQLARRGKRVLGLERFDIPNAMGSSHGVTRMIRLAYHEHPSYVPLLRRAYTLWRELEKASGEQLLFITGGIDAGPPGGQVVDGSLAACEEHGLDHEVLSAREVGLRYPGWRLPPDMVGVLQPDAGFLACERAVLAHVQLAMAAGAQIHAREALLRWEITGGGTVLATTTRGQYEAKRLILSTGAWIADHAPSLHNHAVPERQVVGFFRPLVPELFLPGRFPVGIIEVGGRIVSAVPEWSAPGVKVAVFHHLCERGHPDLLRRDPDERDEEVLRAALRSFFPRANGSLLALKTCLSTNTADERFIIDVLPGASQVIVASPCSGHGFKFASVLGEVLADVAEGARPKLDIAPFGLSRFTRTPAPVA